MDDVNGVNDVMTHTRRPEGSLSGLVAYASMTGAEGLEVTPAGR